MAQKIAAKFHLRLKKAPDLWWNLDKKYARNLVKKIYDDRFDLRPQTDPDRNFYGDIGKAGLSRSNTFAAIFGYCVVGYHFNIDPVVFSSLVYGTYKCAIAANTYNQKHEITFDRQMERTRIRALVKRGTYDGRYLALYHAEYNALKSWMIGGTVLALGCNPTVAALGLFNIFLYYKVYTRLKRQTWLNTQAGAIVGAIPPLMGYLANTGGEFVNNWWLIPTLTLFCWQFPHFYGLAEARNAEYAYAGYKMLGSTSPKSAMVWSASNIGALVLIILWAHYMYTRADQEPKETQFWSDIQGGKMPYYCSYIGIGGIFLAGMGVFQYKWWMGAKSAANTIFWLSTALISFVVFFQFLEQLLHERVYYKKKLDSKYQDLRFLLYRYGINTQS